MNQKRIQRILENMKECGLGQILVADDPAIYYITGKVINPMERAGAILIKDDGSIHAFMNNLFCFEPQDGMTMHYYSDGENVYAMIARELSPGPVGFDDKWLTRHTISVLQEKDSLIPALGSGPVDLARCIKDEEEIRLLRKASLLNDQTVAHGIRNISSHRREQELSDMIQDFFLQNGAARGMDYQLVCYGANAAEPHHAPDSVTDLKEGDCVLFDIACPLDGYWCDMTRTVFYKKVSDAHRKVYETVRAAQQAGIDAVRPGVPLGEVDAAARKVIEDAGYGRFFTHRTGHGVGISVHEAPYASPGSDTIAKPGMCFSIEPGIYIPGDIGVRIEDLVIVTEDGCEVLNHYPKDLQIVGD
jgi:Xaa-Pro dipeptidase